MGIFPTNKFAVLFLVGSTEVKEASKIGPNCIPKDAAVYLL